MKGTENFLVAIIISNIFELGFSQTLNFMLFENTIMCKHFLICKTRTLGTWETWTVENRTTKKETTKLWRISREAETNSGEITRKGAFKRRKD